MDFQAFALSTFGAADDEALDLVKSLKGHLSDRFGKRESRELFQQCLERLSVGVMRGVGAQLSDFASCAAPQDPPSGDGMPACTSLFEEADLGHRKWREWAAAHGFEPAPPTNVPDSLGIRVLASAPDPVQEPVLQRRLFWVDPAIGARVWVRD
jgi:hypothetical protein